MPLPQQQPPSNNTMRPEQQRHNYLLDDLLKVYYPVVSSTSDSCEAVKSQDISQVGGFERRWVLKFIKFHLSRSLPNRSQQQRSPPRRCPVTTELAVSKR